MGKKVISKGYTFEARSWENDGDNLRTNFYTVESEDEARRINKICKELLPSIGNTMDGEGMDVITKYIADNQELFSEFVYPESYIDEIARYLMGNSECYDYRVIQKFTITYSPEDVYLEEVKF